MVIVRMIHIREARLCSGGPRVWFNEQGFDWQDFLDNGIPAEKLLATGNEFAIRVVAIAEKDLINGRR